MKNQPNGALSARQLKAAALLANGVSGREAAVALKCTAETISRWRRLAEFEAYENQLRYQAQQSLCDTLRDRSRGAVETLSELMKTAKNEETRRRAAVDVLSLASSATAPSSAPGIGKRDARQIEQDRELATLMSDLSADIVGLKS